MKNILYKGHHSDRAYALFQECYEKGDLVVFLPPLLEDYSFVPLLPEGEVELAGELWQQKTELPKACGRNFSQKPVAGVFSSGTSQDSKLILYSKENMESSVQGIFELFDRDQLDTIFCYPQPYHTFGLTLGYGASFLLGLRLHIKEGAYNSSHHIRWHEVCDKKTLTLGTPTHFYDLITWFKTTGQRPMASYSCIIGGAKVKKDLWFAVQKDLAIASPSIGYGATEASPGITHLPPGHAPQEDGEIGRPLSHVQVRHHEQGLSFSGPNLCSAIIEKQNIEFPISCDLPDLIEVRPSDQQWIYKTRLNWFLNRGGEKFSLEKLEQDVLADCQTEILCCSLPDPRLGEDLGVLIKAQDKPKQGQIDQVYNCLKKRTGRDFNSRACLLVSNLPLNTNLKKDRRQATTIIQSYMMTAAPQTPQASISSPVSSM